MRDQRDKSLNRLLNDFHGRSQDTQAERLALCQEFADYVIKAVTKDERLKYRKKFNRSAKSDFAPLPEGDWYPCFVCWMTAEHRHHIIELANGGDNRRRNWVFVCKKCHSDIHPWLKGEQSRPLRLVGMKIERVPVEPTLVLKDGKRRFMPSVSRDRAPRLVKSKAS